jgi:phage regulator Rha-like protein
MSIALANIKGQTVVDSRIIAEGLGIEHESLLRTIARYENEIQQAFGVVRFQVGASQMPDGRANPNPAKHFLLTEDQTTFVLTLIPHTIRFRL